MSDERIEALLRDLAAAPDKTTKRNGSIVWAALRTVAAERDAARAEVAELERLREHDAAMDKALRAEVESERAIAVSAERYERAIDDATLRSVADDAGCSPGDLLDYVISALGITVTKEVDRG